jgi:hypothetical protein
MAPRIAKFTGFVTAVPSRRFLTRFTDVRAQGSKTGVHVLRARCGAELCDRTAVSNSVNLVRNPVKEPP